MPWAFAAAEWYLSGGGRRAQAGLAAAVGLQFLAGHSEASLHRGLGLGLYCLVRWALGERGWRPLAGLAVSALAGTMVAAVQPLLSVAITTRLTAVLCLVVPALGGLGVEAVWSSARPGGRLSVALARVSGFGLGLAGLACAGAAVILVSRRGGAGVERLWPPL